jgi:hypothetical protein
MAPSFGKKQKKVSEGPTLDFNGGSFVKKFFLGFFSYQKAGRSNFQLQWRQFHKKCLVRLPILPEGKAGRFSCQLQWCQFCKKMYF